MRTLVDQSRDDMLDELHDALMGEIMSAIRNHGADPQLCSIIGATLIAVLLDVSEMANDPDMPKVVAGILSDTPGRAEWGGPHG